MSMPSAKRFILLREVRVPERNAVVQFYRHRTGADVVSVLNDDDNKVFGIAFRTPPTDSTGIAHILEHAVLCGSRKYPVKEPFVELLKGSLKTFLNAFTYPDKTCYPVASRNERDLHNLMDVYLDAVFYPRLTPAVFQQEGWHYELETPDAPLAIKGVVYNEMKGVYSSPDSRFGELCQQSLFPDTPYGLDSGGDPQVIPTLTFAAFRRFHRTYYHPSNAFIFFAGDDNPDARLAHLAEYLDRFRPRKIRAEIPLQSPFLAPRRVSEPFPVEPDAPGVDRGFSAVNWALPEPTDPVRTALLALLAHVLGGTPASPLYQALLESGLGEEVLTGLEPQLRQMTYTAGLRGIRPSDAGQMESIIFETLDRVAKEGPHPELIEAALNTWEFRLRENNTGGFPRGLAMMLSALNFWTYGSDPLHGIAFEATLAQVKRLIAEAHDLWGRLIREHLLENLHRSVVVLEPDTDLAARRERQERERLESLRRRWSPQRVEKVIRETLALREAQVRPDPPEALAKIPTLSLGELRRDIERIPCEIREAEGVRWYWHDLFTSGIVYLDLAFPLRRLPPQWLPHAGVLDRGLFETGTSSEDYAAFSRRIGRCTGGVHAAPMVALLLDRRDATVWYRVGGKCLVDRIEDLCAIIRDALLDARLDFAERISPMLLEEKSDAEASVVPAGNRIVEGRLAAQFTEAGWLSELTDGLEHLFWLRRVAANGSDIEQEVLQPFLHIRRHLFVRRGVLVNLTASATDWARIEPAVRHLLAALPAGDPEERGSAAWPRQLPPAHEALSIPAQVNYVGVAFDLDAVGYRYHGSASVITRFLNTTWLWERVRVQGGAYGGYCRYDRSANLLTFLSYRDPNLERTIEIFRGTAAFLQERPPDSEEVRRSIIGAIGEIDPPLLPDAKGRTSWIRHLTGLTDEERQRVREQVLETEARHFREFSDILAAAPMRMAVLGARDRVRTSPFPLGEPRRDIAVL